MAENTYTIKSAAAKFGHSQVYIRRAIREGKLESSLEPISEGSKTQQHVFTQEQYEAWRADVGGGSRREDGRRKFTLYATMEEQEAIVAAIEAAELEGFDPSELLMLANPPKSN